MYKYKTYGFTIESYFAIDFLQPFNTNKACEIIIERNQDLVTPKFIKNKETYSGGDISNFYIFKKKTVLIKISNGKKIEIKHLRDKVSSDYLSKIILNAPLGFCIYQKRKCVLHASAIFNGKKAYLFMGLSRSGKSSIAAHFSKDFRFITEDVSIIDFENHKAYIRNGLPLIKLSNQIAGKYNFKDGYPINDDDDERSYYVLNNINPKRESFEIDKCFLLDWSTKNSISKASDEEILRYFLLCNHSAFPHNSCKESSKMQMTYLKKVSKTIDFFVFQRQKKINQISTNELKLLMKNG